MKSFKDLEIEIPNDRVENFISKVSQSLNDGWYRDEEKENCIQGVSADYYVFVCKNRQKRSESALYLTRDTTVGLRLANIVPRFVSELSRDEYNEILDEFYEKFLYPAAKSLGYNINVSSGTISINDFIGSESFQKLESFSGLANQRSGTGHACDHERWYDFVLSVFLNNETLDAYILKRWFMEVEKWNDEEVVSNIIAEYEYEMGLLSFFKERHPSCFSMN